MKINQYKVELLLTSYLKVEMLEELLLDMLKNLENENLLESNKAFFRIAESKGN